MGKSGMDILKSVIVVAIIVCLSGCVHSEKSAPIQPRENSGDQIKQAVDTLLKDLVAYSAISASANTPVVGFCGLENRSDLYMDMQEFKDLFAYYGSRIAKIRFNLLPNDFCQQSNLKTHDLITKDGLFKLKETLGWDFTLSGEVFSQLQKDSKGLTTRRTEIFVHMYDNKTREEVWNARHTFVQKEK